MKKPRNRQTDRQTERPDVSGSFDAMRWFMSRDEEQCVLWVGDEYNGPRVKCHINERHQTMVICQQTVTDKHTHTDTHIDTDRHTHTHRYTQTDIHTDRRVKFHIDKRHHTMVICQHTVTDKHTHTHMRVVWCLSGRVGRWTCNLQVAGSIPSCWLSTC